VDASDAVDPAPQGLRARLRWTGAEGAIHDGPRRYLLMRADVLMGMLRRLPDAARIQAAIEETTL
jgi:hypothetical protein